MGVGANRRPIEGRAGEATRGGLVRHARLARLPPPLDLLLRLAPRPGTYLRLAAGPGHRGTPCSVLAVEPTEVVSQGRWPAGLGLAEALAPLAPRPVSNPGPGMPFGGGWAGYVGYEARSGVEARPPARRSPHGFPTLWLGRYPAALVWDHGKKRAWIVGEGSSTAEARARARELAAHVARVGSAARSLPAPTKATRLRLRTTRGEHEARVRAARRAIRAGELFQVNLSHRIDARLEGDPRHLFQNLARVHPAPYMTFLDLGNGRALLSASPERFIRVRGRVAETDPMKGTRPRGRSPSEDRRLRAELEASEKERAELAMIVDLSRNDLARVADPGSVRVVTPRRLLRFAGVHQAIGVVRARLRAGLDGRDLLAAAFPPGSVTGAPKVRAMELLDELEGEGRGPYCGAIGHFDSGGDLDLAVGIRTLLVSGRTVSLRVGGGVTLRSDPAAEWEETVAKARTLLQALAVPVPEDAP